MYAGSDSMAPMFRTLILTLVSAAVMSAQTSTASVSGTVRDQTAAVIPAANVVLSNADTGLSWRTSTNVAGVYIFPAVPPGAYRLTVEFAGMQKYEATLTVQVQQNAVIDPTLTPGQATTTVEVRDVTPVVTVDSPTLGHVLERQRIEQLPINGRFLSSLMVTVAGMEGNRAYGLREGSQEFVLDGSALSDRNTGGNVRRPPGLDTIQEFKVEANSSSAKFTRPTTVVISTKSGTNDLQRPEPHLLVLRLRRLPEHRAIHGRLLRSHGGDAPGRFPRPCGFTGTPVPLVRPLDHGHPYVGAAALRLRRAGQRDRSGAPEPAEQIPLQRDAGAHAPAGESP